MNPLTLLVGGLKAAFVHILGAVLTKELFVWLICEITEAAVKSTKNDWDDRLHAKMKAAVDALDD